MITYQREFLSISLIEELQPLLESHKNEVAVYDFFTLSPRWDIYQQLEDANLFILVTARDSAGTLVGYVSYSVTPSMHYSEEMFADMDVIFIEDHVRNSGVGSDLLTEAESILLKEHPITMLTLKMKTWAPFKGLAIAQGYEEKEIMFTKYTGS